MWDALLFDATVVELCAHERQLQKAHKRRQREWVRRVVERELALANASREAWLPPSAD